MNKAFVRETEVDDEEEQLDASLIILMSVEREKSPQSRWLNITLIDMFHSINNVLFSIGELIVSDMGYI